MVLELEKDFDVLPDFKTEIKLKDQSLQDSLKKILEVFTTLDKFKTKVVAPDEKKNIK